MRLWVFWLVVGLWLALPGRAQVREWLTTADRGQLVAEQQPLALGSGTAAATVIQIDDAARRQTVDGFGFALTGGSAELLERMDAGKRRALLEEIFGTGPGDAGVSYLRVSVGASDMNARVYTYDDVPAGESDPGLRRFSLAEDERSVLPVLREILAIRPGLAILASPWTAPSWMKTNGLPKDGHLRVEDYGVYAAYLVRYLQGMRAAGVPIAALTMQNEPLNPKNTPSMVMEAGEQAAFLRDALGPALRRAGLRTKVVLYDHNCDRPDFPLAVLGDAGARAFADGSGFHLYAGDVAAMTAVHEAYPAKNVYFTEQMVVEDTRPGVRKPVAEPVARVVIGAMRNWARTVLLWNLAADANFGPHTGDGGCPVCQGAVTIDGDRVERNIAYWTVAQVARFVPPGSVVVGSTEPDAELVDVAFVTPAGRHVLVVANVGTAAKAFAVRWGGGRFGAGLGEGDVGTFVW